MAIQFNADEIFEMAEQIERNGAIFYRKAAELDTVVDSKKFLLDLAVREDDHEKTFVEMHAALSDAEKESFTYDPNDEGSLYLQAMADGNVFDRTTPPEAVLSGNETLVDILKIAIEKEKDSVIFYLGIKEKVSAGLGKDKLDPIIKEEMSHIALLSKELKEAK